MQLLSLPWLVILPSLPSQEASSQSRVRRGEEGEGQEQDQSLFKSEFSVTDFMNDEHVIKGIQLYDLI